MNMITIGNRQVNFDDPSPVRLFNNLTWLEQYEPNTPDNVILQEQLRNELRKRGYTMYADYKVEKRYVICAVSQFPFKHSAKCILKKDHPGEHFSDDRPGKFIYW